MQFLVEKSAYAIPRQVVSFHESVIHSGSTDPPVLLRHRPLANKSWAKPSAFVSFLGKYYAYSSISLHLRHRRLFLVQQPFRYPLASSSFLLSNAYFVQTSSPPDRNFVSYANVEKQMLFTSQRHRGRGEERERGRNWRSYSPSPRWFAFSTQTLRPPPIGIPSVPIKLLSHKSGALVLCEDNGMRRAGWEGGRVIAEIKEEETKRNLWIPTEK